ncbi:LON peptidase substrate-binding domain-containing protein [Flavisolibacter nicotianae]|uniref:LON peptidase substrate-binding domain-containing protein n=1 Tax=Flavisolibacter nicotianae TaxID=2364882 RepID=UPI000EADE6C7|nr:LON peptidase substrate-binding domain-containing protein [Flavisolibacter nicotianae]
MTNFIPIFPLGIVVYPGESLNLHIFEPRYKQLINECHTGNKPFGIPTVIDNKVQDYGTVVRIKEITTVHENGEMDIKTEGEKVFRVLEVIKEIPDKLYSGAIVNYPVNHEAGSAEVMRRLLSSLKEMYKMLKVEKDFKKSEEQLNSYDLAHHVGFSLQEEYEFLNLMHERQRQEYLKRHLTKVIPLVAEMENLKKKVKLNGHFKNLSAFNFEE